MNIIVPVRTPADALVLDGFVRRLHLRARVQGASITLALADGVPVGAAEQLSQRLDGVRWMTSSTPLQLGPEVVVEATTLDLDAALVQPALTLAA